MLYNNKVARKINPNNKWRHNLVKISSVSNNLVYDKTFANYKHFHQPQLCVK